MKAMPEDAASNESYPYVATIATVILDLWQETV